MSIQNMNLMRACFIMNGYILFTCSIPVLCFIPSGTEHDPLGRPLLGPSPWPQAQEISDGGWHVAARPPQRAASLAPWIIRAAAWSTSRPMCCSRCPQSIDQTQWVCLTYASWLAGLRPLKLTITTMVINYDLILVNNLTLPCPLHCLL